MMTLGQAAFAVGGKLDSAAMQRVLKRVTTDSRNIVAGDLFVALKGESFDGHDYVEDALRDGAICALVRRDSAARFASGVPLIEVRDTRLALGQLARNWRARFSVPLIAIVGSNGKTTVTQMIAAILREHAGDAAFYTEGNLNNDIGLPLTLLRLRPKLRAGVVELGMNHRGEIAYLAGIARPKLALVNNAQREHQEFLHSVAEVAVENASVFDFLPFDGTALINADDPHADYFRDRAGSRLTISFGMDKPADVRGTLREDAAFGPHLHLESWNGAADVVLRIAGRHNAMNAVAAAAATLALAIPLAVVVRGLAAFVPVAGRLVKTTLPGGAVLLDDTYNANPDSVRAAIDVLHGIAGRRVLVLGRMAEVGEHGPAFHREVGAYAKECGIDALITLGAEAAGAAQAFGDGATALDDNDAVTAAARAAAVPGTTLLIKGSRSARMEQIARALTGAPEGGAH